MKYLAVLLFVYIWFYDASGQISGPTNVEYGETAVYSNASTGSPGFSVYYWKVFGGTKLTGETETQVSVKWDQPSSGIVEKWMEIPMHGIDVKVFDLAITVNNIPAMQYTYDLAGNRTHRNTIYLNSSQLKKSSKNGSGSDHEQKQLEESFGELNISVFPNPTKGQINIMLKGYNPEIESFISVYTVNGILLNKIENLIETNILDLSQQPNGIYILVISCNKEYSRWRVVKQ